MAVMEIAGIVIASASTVLIFFPMEEPAVVPDEKSSLCGAFPDSGMEWGPSGPAGMML